MRKAPRQLAGLGQADRVDQLDRPPPGCGPVDPAVQPEALGNLPADGIHRVQRGHRILEHHRHPGAADPLPVGRAAGEQLGAVQPDRSGHLRGEGLAGDNAGLLLRGIAKEDVERGMVLAKGGSITPHTKFKAEVYILTKEEGGRHTPFFKGYRPQFYLRTTDVTGIAELPAGTDMVMPGDNVSLVIELITPVAMEKGLRFAIREGGHTVGAGTIAEIIQ